MLKNELIDFQDKLVEVAKKALTQDGDFSQLGLVLTNNIDSIKEKNFELGFLALKIVDCEDGSNVAILVDVTSGYRILFLSLCYLYPDLVPQLQKALDMSKMFLGTDGEETYRCVLETFFEVSNINEKDVLAGMVRALCQKINAIAAFVLSPAWLLKLTGGEEAKTHPISDISKDNRTLECIACSMDSLTFRRLLIVPVIRTSVDNGVILSFGEPDVLIDNKDGETPLKGKYAELLTPLTSVKA